MNKGNKLMHRQKSAPSVAIAHDSTNGGDNGIEIQLPDTTNVDKKRDVPATVDSGLHAAHNQRHHGMQTRSLCSGRGKPYTLQNGLGFTNETIYLRAPCKSPICIGPDTNSPDTDASSTQPAGEIVYQNVDSTRVLKEKKGCSTNDLRDSGICSDCTPISCETGFTYTRADQTTIIVNSMEVDEQGNNIEDDDDAETRAAIAMSMQCIDDVSPTDQLKESPNVYYTAAGTSSTRRQPAGEIVYQNVDCITKDFRDSVTKIDCTTGSCETGFRYTRADQTTIIVNSMEVNEQGNNIDDDDDADTGAAIAMSMQCIDDVSPPKDGAFDGASPMVKQLDTIHDNTARDWCDQKHALIRDPNDTKKSTPALAEETMHTGKAPELRDSGIIQYSESTTNTRDETSLMNRSPSYENKSFDSVHLSSDGLEQDTIFTMDRQQNLLTCVPEKIPRDYVDNTGAVPGEQQPSSCMGWFFHRKKPDDVGPIYIQHAYATDSQILGDRFGAKLATYKWKKKGNIYYQHFLTDVTDKSPADAMKIQDWDELVLLNDSFVPNLNYEEVQRLFTNVKVDSHTRLTLIIRRITIPDRKHKEWLWYKTSAILVPELDHEPCVSEMKYDPVPGGWDHRFWARMHARNGALYLTVTQDDVTMDKLVSSDADDPRDNQRKICVWCKVLADPDTGLLNRYVLALFGYHGPLNPEPFVAINLLGEAVVSKGTAFWYDYSKIGSQCYIKIHGQYLGCDGANKVGLHKDEQYFVMTGTDKLNSSVQPHDTMDCSTLLNSFSSTNTGSCDSSMDYDSSSTTGSTQSSSHDANWPNTFGSALSSSHDLSMDSGSPNAYGSNHILSHDMLLQDNARDGFMNAELPTLHSALSNSVDDSNSSGYITSSPQETLRRITRSMSRQQTVTLPMQELSLDKD